MKSIKALGVGQLASGPLLTLTIIVINSDTQSSLFTGSSQRERGEISLFIGEGPFHKVQSFIIWAAGGWWRWGLRGQRGTTIKNTLWPCGWKDLRRRKIQTGRRNVGMGRQPTPAGLDIVTQSQVVTRPSFWLYVTLCFTLASEIMTNKKQHSGFRKWM